MPRHLLTRKDSNELRFKITRLPSGDGFLVPSDDSSATSRDKAKNISCKSPGDRLFSQDSTTTDFKALSSLIQQSPKENFGNSSLNAEIKSSENMSSSSSGVLGVKKNFLHRAFQRNYSPGKIYEDKKSNVLNTPCSSQNPKNKTPPQLPIQQHSDTRSISLLRCDFNSEMSDKTKVVNTEYNQITHSESENIILTKNSPFQSEDNHISKTPIKREFVLKKTPTPDSDENDTKNNPNLAINSRIPINPANLYRHDDKENRNPETQDIFKQKSSLGFKRKHSPSPKKLNSAFKQTSVLSKVSSPRKLDFCPTQFRRPCTTTPNNYSSQKCVKESVIQQTAQNSGKLNECPVIDKKCASEKDIQQECSRKQVFNQETVLVQGKNESKTSLPPPPSTEKEHEMGLPLAGPSDRPPTRETPVPVGNAIPNQYLTAYDIPLGHLSLSERFLLTGRRSSTATETVGSSSSASDQDKDSNNTTHTITPLPTPNITHPHAAGSSSTMAYPYYNHHPYHFHRPGFPVPTPPSHITSTSTHPLTPATQRIRNDSGYYTPGNSSTSSSTDGSILQDRGSSSSSSSSSALSSLMSNGASASISNTPSPPIGRYSMPPLASSSPPPVSFSLLPLASPPIASVAAAAAATAGYFHPHLYTSTPYYAQMKALLEQGQHPGEGSKQLQLEESLRKLHNNTLPSTPSALPVMNSPMMQHMAYLSSIQNFNPYHTMLYPTPNTTTTQHAPLDLSSSEQQSPPQKSIRKTLFDQSAHQSSTRYDGVEARRTMEEEKEEDKRNPFGIHKILKVEPSPVNMRIPQEQAYGQASLIPMSPENMQQNTKKQNSRKRPHPDSSSSNQSQQTMKKEVSVEPARKKKKSRDKPPLWGEEVPEVDVIFKDSDLKWKYCDRYGKYLVPDVPKEEDAQQTLISELMALFSMSNLPTVPVKIRRNIFGLRFFPKMQTLFQVSTLRSTEDLVMSYGGIAFDNFYAITDNNIIDSMLKKEDGAFSCLSKKCIDPDGTRCWFQAQSLGKMRRHVKNHMSQKKWVCAFCRVQMTDQTDMARHGTTHTTLKPFPCEECGKAFSQKVTLTNHLKRTHGREDITAKDKSKDKYTCRQCGKHYRESQRDACIEHLMTYHYHNEYQTLSKRKRFPFNAPSTTSVFFS